ncbi:MAG: hypothetical protein A3B91_05125 [Candidatus Yanofskybacteria bacterium RIFCSPHIGHO2_02_FULL_41_29]|uniref:CSD domain-containing protein n=1 Tax=Candidatus Yanofskybacteria bacterium RIFCSPHIGHO2_01_FULL_41_53 TaxID=1802663 RepID=A0A1F8EJA0_9BACT|nr:MAG: hypothetical protein A2650_04125 [Candidatus Yanofskybacteria bacterium RIFCSPHIGHO2_01_FULL_41_53]OGN11673.1 MAG: hypothetical protein A3B91_05125 [Candidatus Yanofskybacteria bacterium RIFCSPHIGHO2_02_FULL_41_29]OGN18034.1 MAG: hypothetical protein A3F48_03280 [Candidatus Yanofskybacteria bacterium RIFCSPHIGHO2_12_FULL_41_9]OGN23433.1 MAG: hypothetical protein A2916_03515 [Candidatus Yanofskybacteria bacterium RIFCSPLOWO2_01_FULL_41_67]OGN30310.1 MAG: hypothetical protein A3H54_04505 
MYNLAKEQDALDQLGIKVKVWASYSSKKYSKHQTFDWLKTNNIEPLKPESDGFLFSSECPNSFLITVEFLKSSDMAVVSALSNGDIQPMTIFSDNPEVYETLKVVPLYQVTDGISTKIHDNSIRVVSVRNGLFQMFEVGVASRIHSKTSYHFLAIQKLYESPLYQGDEPGKVLANNTAYPGYAKWPALQDLVGKMTDWDALPKAVENPEKKIPDTDIKGDGDGRVIFFNPVTGLGMIKRRNGQAGSVYWSQIETDDRFPYLEAGQEVTISGESSGSRGTQFFGVKPAV